MPTSRLTRAPADIAFICDCKSQDRPACKGLAFYKEYEDKRYCVLHYPGKEKGAAFNEELKRKLAAKDLNFSGVWFPNKPNFYGFIFDTLANFHHATFESGANFLGTIFS